MSKIVKNAFFFLMAAVVMAILYFILFGWGYNTYMGADGFVADNNMQTGMIRYRGALYVAAETVESSIARYYYEYCFLPNVHATDGLVNALGASANTSYQYTNPNLSGTADHVSGIGGGNSWTTGWK